MKTSIECITIGSHQEFLQRYGPDQLAILQKTFQAAVRTGNDILFGNIDAFGNALERVQRQTEELSRINANNAKTIANTAKETAAEVYK